MWQQAARLQVRDSFRVIKVSRHDGWTEDRGALARGGHPQDQDQDLGLSREKQPGVILCL